MLRANMPKAFHSKAQGRPELREGRTLGFTIKYFVTPQGLNIVASLCNAFGVTGFFGSLPRMRRKAGDPGLWSATASR
jgi:hypothetical protein